MIDVHRTFAEVRSPLQNQKSNQTIEESKSALNNASAPSLESRKVVPLPTSMKPDSDFLASLKQKVAQHQKQIMDQCAAASSSKKWA